jgi:predicted RNase H-like HicB family nuclease
MKYKIALHRIEEGISVCVPALPGCWSEGDTEDEALSDIQDAIREYLTAIQAEPRPLGSGKKYPFKQSRDR